MDSIAALNNWNTVLESFTQNTTSLDAFIDFDVNFFYGIFHNFIYESFFL